MFGKFFASTFTGSMFGAGADVFAVWGYAIANTVASQVELNPRVIAAAIGMTPERALAAIDVLIQPDSNSRSKNDDGCRLVREGEYAYRVPNHDKYRLIRCEEDRRAYNREAQSKSRKRKRESILVNTPVIDGQSLSSVSAQAEAEAEAEAEDQKISTPKGVEGETASVSPCPIQEIVKLYHELLPMLPRMEKLTKTRSGYIKQRWREDLPDLAQWRNFFTFVGKSSFLTGKVNGNSDRPPFRADIEWLCRPSNFAKISEEKYHRV